MSVWVETSQIHSCAKHVWMRAKDISPVQTELGGRSQDVHHALSPQLLAQDGGGDEAACSANSSTADRSCRGRDVWIWQLIWTFPTNMTNYGTVLGDIRQ